jgi:hypothetical protein
MIECRIDFNIEDSERSIEQLLVRLAPAYDAIARSQPFIVNLTHCRFMGPSAAVLLAGLQMLADRAGVHATFVPPSGPDALRGFCWFSGLEYRLFNGRPPDANHSECVTVPVESFQIVNMGATYSVINLVQRFLNIDEDSMHALETSIFETLNNIHDHARSHVGGLMCARFQKGKGEVRVAVLDHGVTIPGSVREGGIYARDDHSAIKWASAGGNTSKRHGTNLGQGLETLSLLVGLCDGTLQLFSGRGGLFKRGKARTVVRKTDGRLPGTLVSFKLRMREGPAAPI